MKPILIAACIGSLIVMSACKSGPDSSDPKATLASFFKALAKKDIGEARKYATRESAGILDMLQFGLEAAKRMNIKETENELKHFENLVIGDATIDGDHATVPVSDKTKSAINNIILKKEDGAWKVAFDPSAMAEMAGEKISREGRSDINIDSLKNQLQKLNSDSIRKQIREASGMMDSISRMLK